MVVAGYARNENVYEWGFPVMVYVYLIYDVTVSEESRSGQWRNCTWAHLSENKIFMKYVYMLKKTKKKRKPHVSLK